MAQITVELIKYDMDKTKKRKRANLVVDSKSEEAVIEKLEKIHKGEKVQLIHEIIWKEDTNKKNSGETLKGKIKFVDKAKGFGLIRPDSKMDDIFFSFSRLGGLTVAAKDLVQFDVETGPKGKTAINIRLIGKNRKG